MIEQKETLAISCLTKKITKPISGTKFKFRTTIICFFVFTDPNIFHINNQEELHLQYVACAFSIHKVYIIDITEDEQCKISKDFLSLIFLLQIFNNIECRLLSTFERN
jgi:hypothetical protein